MSRRRRARALSNPIWLSQIWLSARSTASGSWLYFPCGGISIILLHVDKARLRFGRYQVAAAPWVAAALSRLSTAAPEFVPGSSARAYETGQIVHLSRKMCGYFTHTYLDGSTETFYNGYFGFVRPDGALVNAEGICFDDLFLHPSDAADDYNPAVGDRVTFRRGTHNGRAKAVEVSTRDVTQRLSQHTYRLVPSDYRPLPAMRGENNQVSLGQRCSPAHDWAHPPPDTAHDEAIAQLLGWRRVA